MGCPLRSNIFKLGTNEQEYFARFPIQVAVLYSPSDKKFVEAFREVFFHLDQLTGDAVVFFAVLDPPEDWIEAARNRSWWQEYQRQFGQTGFSYDDSVLMREIARLFRIAWSSLPSIVVGTNLWTGEFVTSPTSVWDIERQLESLTQLVREWGQPNIDHIEQTLSELIGSPAEYHLPSNGLRRRFSMVYGVLETLRQGYDLDMEEYRRYVQTELQEVERTLNEMRRHREDSNLMPASETIDEILEHAAGKLVAPATVAMRVWENLQARHDIPMAELLDEESLVMVETALRVGNFLELDIEGFPRLPNDFLPTQRATQRPIRIRGNAPKRRQFNSVDFTPGAQGAWKAFEREINLSLIQAARTARKVTMPDFFARYDPNPRVDGRVQTGTRIYKDINQPDRRSTRMGRHRFLPLGDALFVIRAMHNCPTEWFDTVVTKCLHSPLPPHVLPAWERVHRIRNQASHTEPLNREKYQRVLEDTLSPNVLRPLLQIKQSLSS